MPVFIEYRLKISVDAVLHDAAPVRFSPVGSPDQGCYLRQVEKAAKCPADGRRRLSGPRLAHVMGIASDAGKRTQRTGAGTTDRQFGQQRREVVGRPAKR